MKAIGKYSILMSSNASLNVCVLVCQNQPRRTSIHDPLNPFSKPGNRTPAELSRLKVEKDRREVEEYQVRKKQEEDMIRKRSSQMDTIRQQVS
jgi:hypothetical protein